MVKTVVFLGPQGTYSHLVARKRFGNKVAMLPLSSIQDVCHYVAGHPSAAGIVPIENSSGGAIHETVDILLTNSPKIYIERELSLEVRLALLGRTDTQPLTLYSHFAPMDHCDSWLRQHLPKIVRKVVSSTAMAAQRAAGDPHGVALGSRMLAPINGLDVLVFPVEAKVSNVTTFLSICGREPVVLKGRKTTLSIYLPNEPGSLYRLLGTFAGEQVNLSRLISRPIRGRLSEYAFLIDIEGGLHNSGVQRALKQAGQQSTVMRICGSYPVNRRYVS